jgi:hypothetical protein
MSTSLRHDPVQDLPIYRDGFHAGRDVGLAIALAAITAEGAHRERLATHPDSGSHTCRVYAEGVLLTVTRVVAFRFRCAGRQSGRSASLPR